jgi:hypothetical protein
MPCTAWQMEHLSLALVIDQHRQWHIQQHAGPSIEQKVTR